MACYTQARQFFNATSAVNGTYRWRMANTVASSLTLESENIVVEAVDALAANQSIEPSYGGLITAMRWRTDAVFGTGQEEFKGMYTFKYDDKYQLKESNWADATNLSLSTNKFRVAGLNYDPNGNILTLRRYDKDGFKTNDFSYHYAYDEPTPTYNNQLKSVDGYVNNFTYNKIGQMTGEDKVEANADQYVEYDVTGKVVFVYADAAKTQKKVEYLYEDTGFRLAKVNFETQRTTWYIRDASGNIQSVYEQEGVASASNTNAIVQTEVLVYGAGKLATYYPQQDGSTAYEITDHLGNVRALVRDNIAVYAATMEDNNTAEITNPRIEEMQYFNNHTAPIPTVVDTPDKSAYLFWQSGMTGMEAKDKSVGPAIMLKVNAGDKLDLETWARYERKANYARNMDLAVLSQFLGSSFAYQGAFEGSSIAQTVSTFQSAMQGAGFMTDGGDDTRPFAYLNYIVFDANFNRLDAGWQRVPESAGFNPGEEGLSDKHVKVNFTQPIVASQTGFVYVWVSNESEAVKLWFDDLKVTHQGVMVTQATDYAPWGDILREQKTDESVYRFGYQGQFSERDLETGWSHFELREYDPIIGRWTSVDPKRIGWSPYIGMYNNPISGIDPDGGGPGDDMDMEYADAMQQMDINLFDEIRMSGTTLLAGVEIMPDNPSPWQVGWEWLTGTGPRDRAFMDGDMFTEMLKQHEHIQELKGKITTALATGGDLPSKAEDLNYRLGGLAGVPKYIRDYSTLVTAGKTGNLAVTYLGSYSVSIN